MSLYIIDNAIAFIGVVIYRTRLQSSICVQLRQHLSSVFKLVLLQSTSECMSARQEIRMLPPTIALPTPASTQSRRAANPWGVNSELEGHEVDPSLRERPRAIDCIRYSNEKNLHLCTYHLTQPAHIFATSAASTSCDTTTVHVDGLCVTFLRTSR